MRLIDADVLEKKLKDAIEIGRVYDLDGASNFHAVLSDVEHMPTIEPEPQWISCAERLPEKFGYCIVSGGNSVWFARFENGDFNGILSGRALDSVIAWMPLPEPWKEVEA